MAELITELSEEPLTISEDESEEEDPDAPPERENGEGSQLAQAAINAIRPIIARLPEREQFAAADAAARQIRRAMGRPARPRVSGYRMALNAQSRKSFAQDAKDLGREIMAKRNPHFK